MTKKEFLKRLENELGSLSKREKQDAVAFYDELITDKIEAHISEAQAVEDIGGVKGSAKAAYSAAASNRIKDGGNRASDFVSTALLLGKLFCAPVLFPLGIAFYSVFFVLTVTGFALLVSFGATATALLLGSVPLFIYTAVTGTFAQGLLVFGGAAVAGAVCGFIFMILYKVWFAVPKLLLKITTRALGAIYGRK